MGKVRLALLAALVLSVGLLVVLYKISLNGWMVWVERGVIILTSFFALSVAALFLATLFRTKKDLWDTGYFRYMRAFWGDSWGGFKGPLQIDVCRATWLSVITFVLWILLIGIWSYLLYFFIAGTLRGFEQVSLLWDNKASFIDNLSGSIFVLGWIGTILLFVPLWMVGLRESFDEWPGFRKSLGYAYIIFALIVVLFSLVIVPIKYAGLGEYLLFVGLILGGIASVVALIVGTWLLLGKAIPKLRKFFERETVPGALVKARHDGWKQKVCPLITQVIPEEKENK